MVWYDACIVWILLSTNADTMQCIILNLNNLRYAFCMIFLKWNNIIMIMKCLPTDQTNICISFKKVFDCQCIFCADICMYVCLCVCVCVCACVCACMCACVCVSLLPRLVISGVIWTPHDWFNKFCRFYMAAIVSIISKWGLKIEACHRNQPNKSMLALHKPWIHFNNHLYHVA